MSYRSDILQRQNTFLSSDLCEEVKNYIWTFEIVRFAKYPCKQPPRSSAGKKKPVMSKGRYTLGKGSSCIADCACCCNVFRRLLKLERYELNLWIFMHAFVYSSHYWNWIIQSPSSFCRTFQRGRGHLVQYDKKKCSLFTGKL